MSRQEIIITVHGGCAEVETPIPAGIRVIVRDYDLGERCLDQEFVESIYDGDTKSIDGKLF